jgi:beta-lactamase class A
MVRAAVGGVLLCAVLTAPPASASVERPESSWASTLHTRVEEALEDFDGELSLYVLDVQSGDAYAHDADTPTYLSSAIKIAVMLEVLRQVDVQQLRWDEELELGADDLRDGMHRLGRIRPGTRLSVETLLQAMMVDSDNAAADLLIRRVGVDNVKAQLVGRGVQVQDVSTLLDERRRIYAKLDPAARELRPHQIRALGAYASLGARARFLSELMGQWPAWTGQELDGAFGAFYAERVNSASMQEMGRLLEQVARCEGLSVASCSRAHALMSACRTGRKRIAAGLPDSATWAHKTGTQHRRACDMGILYLQPERPIVIAACTRGFWQVSEAERLFAHLGRIISETLEASVEAAPVDAAPVDAASATAPTPVDS